MSKKPVLYYAPRSAPCRSVMMTAAQIGLDLELRIMNLRNGDHRTPEFLKLNPQHTIPVLDDNGVVITDSHVICMHLADKYSTDVNLFPQELSARNEVLTRLFFDCGHLFSRIRGVVEPVLLLGATELNPADVDYLMRAYDSLEHCLKERSFVCGQHLTIADLCCSASMASADDFAPVDAGKFPNVAGWLKRLEQLPYYKACNRDGADILKKAVLEKLAENRTAKYQV